MRWGLLVAYYMLEAAWALTCLACGRNYSVLGAPQVVLPWCPFGGWEYSRETETAVVARRTENTPKGGFESFALGQKGVMWREGNVTGYQAVRRRVWRRVYLDPRLSGRLEADETT